MNRLAVLVGVTAVVALGTLETRDANAQAGLWIPPACKLNTKHFLVNSAQLYLKNAPLDSYHTAAALKGKPVLLIQGTTDLAVPSPLGDLLWERLGKPERWLQDGQGHEVLFMLLPQEFDKMMDWLDRATGLPPGAPHP